MFRHFKGNPYRIEGFAQNAEALEEMIVHRALYSELLVAADPGESLEEAAFETAH